MMRPQLDTRLVLAATTAEELMTPNPVSVNLRTPVHELAALLTDREISGVPVINDAGHPVGVITQTDVVRYERERVTHVPPTPEYYQPKELHTRQGEALGNGFEVEAPERATVGDIMTPAVVAINPEASALDVVAKFLAIHVHRLFVIDDAGVLVGVITALDVLRHLRRLEE
jgi:predicted transcriptional regulator